MYLLMHKTLLNVKYKGKADELNFVTFTKLALSYLRICRKIFDLYLNRTCLDFKNIFFAFPWEASGIQELSVCRNGSQPCFCLDAHDGWKSYMWHVPVGTNQVVYLLHTNSLTLTIASLSSCFKRAYQNINEWVSIKSLY